jgi:hypothetical protein
MVDRHHATLTLKHEVHRGVRGLLVHQLRDLGERLALVLGILGIARIDEDDAIPATGSLDDVPPSGRSSLVLALESRPSLWICQARFQ